MKALTGWIFTGGAYGETIQRDPSPPAFHRKGLRKDRKALTGTTKRLTGRQGPYGKPLMRRDGPYEKGRSLMEGPGSLTGPSQRRTTKRLTGRPGLLTGNPLALTGRPDLRKGLLRGGFLQEGPLRGGFLRGRPLTNYRKAYEAMGGNFRLCAVDQKRPFFPRAGPFLDLLPFKGPFSLTGALTGPPYGKGPLRGGFLREGWALTGSPLRGGTVLTGRAGPYRSPYGQTARKKAPYGEASYEKAPYELQESLQEATGRDFTRIGREFPLVCRRPKKAVFS